MKNLLLLSFLSLTLSYQAFSQKNISDSVTCLPNAILRKVQRDLISVKQSKKNLDSVSVAYELMKARLAQRDSAVVIYQRIDSLRAGQIRHYDESIQAIYSQMKEATDEVAKYKSKDKKRKKTNKTIAAVTAILAAVIPYFLSK